MAACAGLTERLIETANYCTVGHPVFDVRRQRQGRGRCGRKQKIEKRKSTGRIDALVALTMALGIAARPAPVIDVSALIG